MSERPSWDSYFLTLACVASTRSTCQRRHVGAVIVKDRRVISTGYNGAPRGVAHCSTDTCIRAQLNIPSGQRQEICRGAHAEMNAIAQAASVGVSTEGATLFCTDSPCAFCTKAIINAGITRVVFLSDYPDKFAEQLRAESGVKFEQLKDFNGVKIKE